MALDQNAQYPVGTTGPDANYPEGEAINSSAPGALDGYPWEKEGINDLLGFQQALLRAGGAAASGNPDTAVLSQYLQMIVELAQGRAINYDDSGVANAYVLDVQANQQAPAILFDGQTFEFIPANTSTGASTVNPVGLGIKNIVNTTIAGKIIAGRRLKLKYRFGSGDFEIVPNTVVQVVNTQDGAVATGTTVLPNDDTIPQNTEGDEYLTLAITPTNANNMLKIEIVIHLAHTSASSYMIAALFQDSTAGALAASQPARTDQANTAGVGVFTHYMVAGTVLPTTFKVRAGHGSAGTTTFNGATGTRNLGGVMASSVTITEIEA